MKHYAVGVPVGTLNEYGERYFFREGDLLNMNGTAFQVWIRFLHGADLNVVAGDARLSGQIDQRRLIAFLEQLQAAGLIVSEQKLLTCIPQRQGCGIGFSASKKDCAVFLGKAIRVSYLAYMLWAYSDGRSTCKQILDKMPQEIAAKLSGQQMIRAIDELLENNLLLFVA